MHGRVKVRTSEEEKARKARERQEKLKAFKFLMHKIQTKKQKNELDKDLLETSGKVLSSNPDIYTLWNIRRCVLIVLRDTTDSKDELSKLYDEELNLTEYCLKINPKSYCAWHYREWVLNNRIDPNWNNELNLCNTYLKLDERNFHTWDYRRLVVQKCNPSLKEEFDYTTEKLYDNFSNYSAWHYRSKMLLELYPDLKGGRPIQSDHHKNELKLVQSAAFTDPDDTSAWFYQRWLLGAVKKSKSLVVAALSQSRTTVAFNAPVSEDFVSSTTKFLLNNMPIKGNWISCSGYQYDSLWLFDHDTKITDNLDLKVEYKEENGSNQVIPCIKSNSLVYVGKAEINFRNNYSQPVIDELKTQLESCRQLLQLEPDNRWTLLTTTVFLHCIDAEKHHNEVISNLKLLKNLDKLRSGYYDDLITKWSIEKQITTDFENKDNSFKIKFDERITSLPHLQYYSFCEEVDLSNQKLSSSILPSLKYLQHCKVLYLENNNLTTIKGFPPMDLNLLNLKGNALDKQELEKFLVKNTFKIIL